MIKALVTFGLTRRAIIVMGLLVFCAAGAAAFLKLNIEAYPNPAPVILEITAQAAGQSAEEMEKYYTIPMEVGLYSTPGVDTIRSTSFYGLSFVRVTFKYGVDYFPAYTQAALNLQQNVNLPGNQVPQIQQSSLVGEIYRYQVVGPKHFGPDQPAHHPGLGRGAAPPHRAGRRADQQLGRHHQAVQRRGQPAQAGGLQRHHPADDHRARQRQQQRRRPRDHHWAAVGQHPRHRPDRRRRRRRPDQGLPRRRHREHRPQPGERRAGAHPGRRRGVRGLRAPPGYRRPRTRRTTSPPPSW